MTRYLAEIWATMYELRATDGMVHFQYQDSLQNIRGALARKQRCQVLDCGARIAGLASKYERFPNTVLKPQETSLTALCRRSSDLKSAANSLTYTFKPHGFLRKWRGTEYVYHDSTEASKVCAYLIFCSLFVGLSLPYPRSL